jgi:hypothetical protein
VYLLLFTRVARTYFEVLANAAVELFGGFYAFELRRHVQLVSSSGPRHRRERPMARATGYVP